MVIEQSIFRLQFYDKNIDFYVRNLKIKTARKVKVQKSFSLIEIWYMERIEQIGTRYFFTLQKGYIVTTLSLLN